MTIVVIKQKLYEEISKYQPQMDKFCDNAQALIHASSDIRLSTHVSQMTNRYHGLLSLVKVRRFHVYFKYQLEERLTYKRVSQQCSIYLFKKVVLIP